MTAARLELCFWLLVLAAIAGGSEFLRRQRLVDHALKPVAIQEVPANVVNAPQPRVTGPDGQPLLDHGSGW